MISGSCRVLALSSSVKKKKEEVGATNPPLTAGRKWHSEPKQFLKLHVKQTNRRGGFTEKDGGDVEALD